MKTSIFTLLLCISSVVSAQDYFLDRYAPYADGIPSPQEYLGYGIGDYHTRHDRIVGYLEALDEASDLASLTDYGKTHELRRLVILQISSEDNISNIEAIREDHMKLVDPESGVDPAGLDIPVFVNLAYNVHGNEPSGSEAALLSAYVLVASEHPDIVRLRNESIVFLDPTINPDGRDRHTQWANTYRANALTADPMDAEHNEMWPRGRTNHYWFDLNRDWLLAVHPESQGKLGWYHQWYPNVVTDFHEMGTNSSYFFEPMKPNGSKDPIMPIENYTFLNDTFASYYQHEMDSIGSLYFTKEVFDGTYPGYGSSYPDLQGGLGILFEQASSRGHLQETDMGEMSFAYTIRNQFVNAIATVKAAVENKEYLHQYQQEFFQSAIQNARDGGIGAYVYGDAHDDSRLRAFTALLIRHGIEVHDLSESVSIGGVSYDPGEAFVVPTAQPQYRMVQTMFETYDEYRDSVFYDASAWSLANAYNMKYATVSAGSAADRVQIRKETHAVPTTQYAYLIPWSDYQSPRLLHHLQSHDVRVMAAQKPFQVATNSGVRDFSFGALVVPIQKQTLALAEVRRIIQDASDLTGIEVFSATTGLSATGVDLGSRWMEPLDPPRVLTLVGNGVSSYEVGYVWHLMDTRVGMPITKLRTDMFGRVDLDDYSTLVMVSGSYSTLDSQDIKRIKAWVGQGNTLITIGEATGWAVRKGLVKEKLVTKEKNDSAKVERLDYVTAPEIRGRDEVGGTIFKIDLDTTHPLGYGYHHRELPVYRNNNVWLAPSENEFSNVAVYTDDPHVDGFITEENLQNYLKKSVSVMVSPVGGGRAVMFTEDPNFRGTWYGTNKMFLNAVFFGQMIRVP